eukprot:RCo023880
MWVTAPLLCVPLLLLVVLLLVHPLPCAADGEAGDAAHSNPRSLLLPSAVNASTSDASPPPLGSSSSSGGGGEGTSSPAVTPAASTLLTEVPVQDTGDHGMEGAVEVNPRPSAAMSSSSAQCPFQRLTPRPGKLPELHHVAPNTPTSALSPCSCPTPCVARSPESLFSLSPPSTFNPRCPGAPSVISPDHPALRSTPSPTRGAAAAKFSRKPAPTILAPLRLPHTGAAVPTLILSTPLQTSAPNTAAVVPNPTPATILRRSTFVSQWALHKTTTADPLLASHSSPLKSGNAIRKAVMVQASRVRSRSAPPRLAASAPPSRSCAITHRLTGVLVSKIRILRVLPVPSVPIPGSITRTSRLVASPSMPLLVRCPSTAP